MVIKHIFNDNNIKFIVIGGDITSDYDSNEENILNRVIDKIQIDMNRYMIEMADIVRVIHIVDTDGTFIPKENAIIGDSYGIEYSDEFMSCGSLSKMLDRNVLQSSMIKKLVSTKSITEYNNDSSIMKVPYTVYYFSRNMEHVLHNISENLTKQEKISLSDEFHSLYKSKPQDFIEYISKSEFAVDKSYEESWEFIMIGLNSLKRYSNINLIIKK